MLTGDSLSLVEEAIEVCRAIYELFLYIITLWVSLWTTKGYWKSKQSVIIVKMIGARKGIRG